MEDDDGQLTIHGFGVNFADVQLAGKFEAEPRLNPVPGPLPAAGAVMSFGWVRKLRRRLQAGR